MALLLRDLAEATNAVYLREEADDRVMRKQCRHCRSTTNTDAPYCDACGCVFAEVPPRLPHAAFWSSRVIAIALGLLVAVIFNVLWR